MISCPLCAQQECEQQTQKNNFDIYGCQECRFIFAWPRPDEAQLHAFYQGYKNNESYIKKVRKKLWTSKRKVRRLKPYASGNDFIDIGCSIGCVVEAARELGFNAQGVDLSQDAVAFAQEMFPENHFSCQNPKDLIEEGKRFDVMYCSEVLEHIIDPTEFLQQLRMLLRDSGILYLTTPDIGHWTVPKKLEQWRHLSPPEHISLFTKKSLQLCLEQSGFEVVRFSWNHKSTLKVLACAV